MASPMQCFGRFFSLSPWYNTVVLSMSERVLTMPIWIDRPEEKPKSIWHRKFPLIGICLVLLESGIFFAGPTVLYYLGVYYKSRGVPEGARFLLQASSQINPWDQHNAMSRHFIRFYLPRQPASRDAMARNVAAFNNMNSGQTAMADKQFRQLINDYPRFEWPYGNLAILRQDAGDLAGAKKLCYAALHINPDYLNAHRTLARIYFQEGKFEESGKEIALVIKNDPEDKEAIMLAALLAKKLGGAHLLGSWH